MIERHGNQGTCDVFRAGADWLAVSGLDRGRFVSLAGERMTALLELYHARREPGLPPPAALLDVRSILATGTLAALRRYRLVPGDGSLTLSEIPLAPFASLRGRMGGLFARGGIPHAIVAAQAPLLAIGGRSRFLALHGMLDDVRQVIAAALLPLCGQEGEVVECLLAFRQQTGDVAGRLIEELAARDIDQQQ